MRRTLVAAAATMFAVGGVMAGATTQAAAAPCTKSASIISTSINPRTVVLGVANPKGVTVTTKVRTGCQIDRVEVGLYGPNFVDTYDLRPVSTRNGVTTYETGLRISPGSLPNAEAGRWQSYVTAWGSPVAEVAGPEFQIKRAARLTTNASPEPVRAGHRITVKGNLTRASWDRLRYAGYGHKTVQLQWRAPNGSYQLVKRVTGAADGSVRTTVTAREDGCFRFVFEGNGTTGPVSAKGDCLDVR
jgi:hypothetical protein